MWNTLVFCDNDIFTGSDANSLQENFTALAEGQAGAPAIDVNSFIVTGIASISQLDVRSLGSVEALEAIGGGIQTDSGGTNEFLKTKVIEIGSWDMDAVFGVLVAHGLTLSQIRSISVGIRRDVNNWVYDFPSAPLTTGTTDELAFADDTDINLIRSTTGLFDNINFDDGSSNRGWVTIIYAV